MFRPTIITDDAAMSDILSAGIWPGLNGCLKPVVRSEIRGVGLTWQAAGTSIGRKIAHGTPGEPLSKCARVCKPHRARPCAHSCRATQRREYLLKCSLLSWSTESRQVVKRWQSGCLHWVRCREQHGQDHHRRQGARCLLSLLDSHRSNSARAPGLGP